MLYTRETNDIPFIALVIVNKYYDISASQEIFIAYAMLNINITLLSMMILAFSQNPDVPEYSLTELLVVSYEGICSRRDGVF